MRRTLSLFLFGLFSLSFGCTYYDGWCAPEDGVDDCPHCGRADAGRVDGRDVGASLSCAAHEDCPFERACSEGVCVPAAPCASDRDCNLLETCDARGTCVPRPDDRCMDASTCAAGELCVESRCTPRDAVCTSDLDCGLGRGCVDNACRPYCASDAECDGVCIAAHCVPVPECAVDAECEPLERCESGRCATRCATHGDCGVGELCDGGTCRPDVAPRDFCASDADCAAGHPCVDGVCRTVCPTGTDEECQRADVQLVACGTVGERLLCLVRSESSPECATAGDCAAGEHCIDALCR